MKFRGREFSPHPDFLVKMIQFNPNKKLKLGGLKPYQLTSQNPLEEFPPFETIPTLLAA